MQTILSFLSSLSERIGRALRSMLRLPSLPAGDLLHDRNYRRIFAPSVIITTSAPRSPCWRCRSRRPRCSMPPHADGLADGGRDRAIRAVCRCPPGVAGPCAEAAGLRDWRIGVRARARHGADCGVDRCAVDDLALRGGLCARLRACLAAQQHRLC